ncbi:MAG: glutamine synthetase III [Clostridiales bacterium]|nr:glutamine synthetase III [Candidatus Equinaster intestinalis]
MAKITEYFGLNVFNDAVMKEKLSADTYDALKKCIKQGKKLDITIANDVAAAMKDWAVEKGATHFTHWFQPLTGITAEKHDSFIAPTDNGGVIMEFSGKELIKGEGDASSFPSGGLRATFEARGYTVWDSSSYAFVKENTLCIPTAFCSYGGEALDKKTPLLRSMEFVGKQAKRIVRLFGNEAAAVLATVGPEQEYFLVDKEVFAQRPDLKFCGRTLIGMPSPKGQEMDDHYYGVIKPRVAAFMKELDEELWKLGIYAKTEHNEVAPAQHELAPIFTTANIAADHNQLTMEVMKKVAERHGLVCILHEKPFASVNGSGKHNNWALSTDTGVNLLDPGKTPEDNMQFLLFMCAVIKAVDEHQDLLRLTVASAGNDHRLGANEAPPAIVSMFLGDELTAVLDAIETDTPFVKNDAGIMKIGAKILPNIPKDNTDRNRTSPFAFTGNKFEFRMVGSSASISGPNTVLNTIVGSVLKEFADKLENAEDLHSAVHTLIKETYHEHKRIIFNGDGYADSWEKEAEKRGLLNLKTTAASVSRLTAKENVELFTNCGVLSLAELQCRRDIALDNYSKTIHIEALTLLNMIRKDIVPAVSEYIGVLAKTVNEKTAAFGDNFGTYEDFVEVKIASILSENLKTVYEGLEKLENAVAAAEKAEGLEAAKIYEEEVRVAIEEVRRPIDICESYTERSFWPYPSYADLLFSI